MAFSYVSTKVTGSGVTTRTTAGIDTTGKRTLLVSVADTNQNVSLPPDSKGNTFTQVGTTQTAAARGLSVWICENATVGAGHTIQVDWTSGSADPTVIFEAVGGTAGTALDSGSLVQGSGSPNYTLTSNALAQANSVVFSFVAGESGSNPATYANTTGFTIDQSETNGNLYWTGAAGHLEVAATTAVQSIWTQSGASGTAPMFIFALAAEAGPLINTEPSDATVYQGETAQFSVSATTSGGSLSYQWQVDTGGGFSNVSSGSGGTTDTYTTPACVVADSGDLYRCQVTDSNGTTNTISAELTVLMAVIVYYYTA